VSLPEELKKQEKDWEETTVRKVISRYPERKPEFVTGSDKTVERLYLPESFSPDEYLEKQGFPGRYPYTRGVQPTMYRGRLWTMRQYAGFGTAEESNQRYRFLLEQGQTGLSVAFDLPTQIGYDSNDPRAEGEVGKVGVAIDTLRDMEILFDSIPLDKISTSMTINAPAAILLAMYIVVAEKKGIGKDKLRGTIQNDILKEYIARGTYIFPPAPSMRLITDVFAYCTREVPQWNTISISGYHIREAGSDASQEVAFTLANGIEYVRAAVKAGLTVDDFAGLKLRTAGILPTLALNLMGAAPLTMGVTEIHEAMARGTVDGIQTGGFWGVAFGLCDIAKYCSIWPVQSQFYCVVMANKDSFNALPADLQEIVQDVNREMQGQAAYAIGIVEQNCLYIAIDMIGKTEVIRPEKAELDKVREICKPTIDKWLELAGPHGPEILDITSEYASGAEIMLK